MDNKQKKGKQDRAKVSSQESYEVEYVHSKFPKLSHQEVAEAVKVAGPNREAIIKHLKEKEK